MSGGSDGSALVWDAVTGNIRCKLAHAKDVDAVAISSNGAIIATVTDDGICRLWIRELGSVIKSEIAVVAFTGMKTWSLNGLEYTEVIVGKMPGDSLIESMPASPFRVWCNKTTAETIVVCAKSETPLAFFPVDLLVLNDSQRPVWAGISNSSYDFHLIQLKGDYHSVVGDFVITDARYFANIGGIDTFKDQFNEPVEPAQEYAHDLKDFASVEIEDCIAFVTPVKIDSLNEDQWTRLEQYVKESPLRIALDLKATPYLHSMILKRLVQVRSVNCNQLALCGLTDATISVLKVLNLFNLNSMFTTRKDVRF